MTPLLLDHHMKLVRAVRAWNEPNSLVAYLEKLVEVVRHTELEEDDPRLVTSTPKGLRGWFLPVTINNRYVLAARNQRRRDYTVILGADFVRAEQRMHNTACWHFRPLFGERLEPPFLCSFPSLTTLEQTPIRASWLEAARLEVHRARRSVFRQHHNRAVYRAAVDLAYRTSLLEEACSSQEEP